MSNIDNVINRARQPGGFSERQQFTVARERAIRKMREFALADPHFYILELIQAAVSNGGSHVHIEASKSGLEFTYVGGGYTREELAQLFDFLFAAKTDVAHSDVRQLALGVNALMLLEPDRIIIESGEGSLESTDRIVISENTDTVEVGTPDKPLRGTFIRAEGLNRGAVKGKSNLDWQDYGPPECTAIERRCLSAPIPIIVNNEPVFGYSAQRTPVIFGYHDVVTFDEGDLYGSIGIPEHRHKQSFKLMTYGCWIESTEAAVMDEKRVGGVICYDRLNKTADHSGIVRDERFEELWARIRPYARQVVEGKAGQASYRVKRLGGQEIATGNLRDFFRSHERVVVIEESVRPESHSGEYAGDIGRALEAPVLRVAEDALDSVRVMSGSDCEILEPNLEAPGDLECYRRPPTEAPARPWLAGKVDLEEMEVEGLAERVVAEEAVDQEVQEELIDHLGTREPVRGTIYTPAETDQARELYVRVISAGRTVWEGPVQSPFPGHILDITLPAVAPSYMQRQAPRADGSHAELIARVVARKAIGQLQEATRRALEGLAHKEETDSSTGTRIALAALSRSALKRLRSKEESEGSPGIHFSLIRPQPGPDLLEMKIFQTLDGTRYNLRGIEELMDETGGLVYGVVPEVEPALEGLDRSRILDLDLERERHLMTIVGDAAYVRVDRRDLLAEQGPFQVRDMAIGLRNYPDFPLLVEGGNPSKLGDEEREELTRQLVEQLTNMYLDVDVDPSIRREAVRHLQWFICRRQLDEPEAETYGVEAMPLFLDGEGRTANFSQVRRGFEQFGGIEMIDGRSSDVCELGSLTGEENRGDEPVAQLTMNTWVYRLLEPLGEIRGAFDFDFSDREAADVEATPSEAFIEHRVIDGEGYDGRVGVPLAASDRPAIAVVDPKKSTTSRMHQPAVTYGVTGFIHVETGSVEARWEELRSTVTDRANEIIESLMAEVSELTPGDERFERVTEFLFDFAARQLQMSREPDGTISAAIDHPWAQRILELPLFPTAGGNPVSALRLIREFCIAQSVDEAVERVELADEIPEHLEAWLDRHLTTRNVIEPPGASAMPAETRDVAGDSLAARLSSWLQDLRPDDHPKELASRLGDRPADGLERREWSIAGESSRLTRNDGYGTDVGQGGHRDESDEIHPFVRVVAPEDVSGVDFNPEEPCRYISDTRPTLLVNSTHPMVRRASNPENTEAFAWLLLGCYAHINDVLVPVTNEHELEFQRRVADFVRR